MSLCIALRSVRLPRALMRALASGGGWLSSSSNLLTRAIMEIHRSRDDEMRNIDAHARVLRFELLGLE